MKLSHLVCIFSLLVHPGCTSEKSVIFDFEDGLLQKWVTEGNLPKQPVFSQRADFNPHGTFFIGTAELGGASFSDNFIGSMRSPLFKISKRYMLFRLGGKKDIENCFLALYLYGEKEPVFKETGSNSELMITHIRDLEDYVGKDAYIALVDNSSSTWGHINFDYMQLVNE